LITITGGLYIWQQARAGRHGNSELGAKTIAVLPFRPLDSESNDEQLRLGLADALISRLSNLRDITVRPTSAVLRYSDTPRNTTTPGLELGADAVLDGTIQKVGNHLRVNVQLVRVSDGVAVWSQKFDEQFNDVLTLEDSISEQVATKLIGKLSNETRTYLANRPRNTEAYEAYVRGRYFWNKRSEEKYRKALNQFQEAIDFDPSYALAYSGLADCYLFLAFESAQVSEDNYERARAAAVRALELDQRLAEAHTTLAAIAAVHDRNWSEAEKEYKKAIESNPNYSTAHHWYAWDLLMANRLEEALFEMRKAHELDPLSTNVNTALGQIYYYMRRYDEAVEQFKKTIDLDADNIISRNFLAMAYEQKGMFAEAIAEYQKILERNRTDVFALGGNAHAHALMRRKTEAQRFLAALKKRVDSPAVVNYQIAAVYTALGDRTEAVRWLERIPHGSLKDVLVPLKFDPRLDQLRDYPKYKSYLRNLS
jgi:TolB-like protein/Tfp pilus assembly protein PilF